jgi:DUF971 family protein
VLRVSVTSGLELYNAGMSPPDPDDDLSLKSLKADREALLAQWNDGVTHRIPWRTLRENCPCATCRKDRAEPAKPAAVFNILKPEEIGPIRVTGMFPIGNYAYQIDFSDGHKTGIFSLELLREIGETCASEAS